MKQLVLLTFIFILAVGCSGRKQKETDVSLRLNLGAMVDPSLTGGVMVYGREFGQNLMFAKHVTSTDSAVVIPNGLWHFAAIGWNGGSNMSGQAKCEFTENPVLLDGKDVTVSLALSANRCDDGVFGSLENSDSTGQPLDMSFVTCARADQVYTASDFNCQLGRAQSYRVVMLETLGVGGPGNLPVDLAMASACQGNNSPSIARFDTNLKIPAFSADLPAPMLIVAYDQDNCVGDEENFYFYAGLENGSLFSKFHANMNVLDNRITVFLKSNMCLGDGSTNAPFANGAGVPSPDVNFICTGTQLSQAKAFVNGGNANAKFSLEQDVDLTGFAWENFMIGDPTQFTGEFYGNDNTIFNLNINAGAVNEVGLFADIGTSTGKIEHLNIVDANVQSTGNQIGILAGLCDGCSIKKSHVSITSITNPNVVSSPTGTDVGGLVGRVTSAAAWNIEEVSVYGTDVTGTTNTGGIFGSAQSIANASFWKIESEYNNIIGNAATGGAIGRLDTVAGFVGSDLDSIDAQLSPTAGSSNTGGAIGYVTGGGTYVLVGIRATGDIDLVGASNTNIGGVIGSFDGGTLGGLYANIDIDASGASAPLTSLGGLVGYIGGAGFYLQTARADGDIHAPPADNVGGLIGNVSNTVTGASVISMSQARGDITDANNNVGGLIGHFGDIDVQLTSVFAEGDVSSGGANVGGLVGTSVNAGSVTDCYANGDILGASPNTVGGLAGNNTNGAGADWSQCYYDGAILATTPTTVNALFGSKVGGAVSNNLYFNSTIAGFGDAEGTGLTSANMLVQGNFTGFVFGGTNPWVMPSTGTPELEFQDFFNTFGQDEFFTGSSTDPLPVCTPAQWNRIGSKAHLMHMAIELVCNLDFANGAHVPIGDNTNPYTGRFMANNHAIRNIFFSNSGADQVGLFGVARDAFFADEDGAGGFQTLYLENVHIEGRDFVGGLVGEILPGTSMTFAVVIDEYSTITGRDHVGGVVGRIQTGTGGLIAGVQMFGNVDGTAAGGTGTTGGIVGNLDSTAYVLTNNIVAGDVDGVNFVGGIAGRSTSDAGVGAGIHESACIGCNVNASGGTAGGIVGDLAGGTIQKCLSVRQGNDGSVVAAGLESGGIAGFMSAGTALIENNLVDGMHITGSGDVGGVIGDRSAGGVQNNLSYFPILTGGTDGIQGTGATGGGGNKTNLACIYTNCTKTDAELKSASTYTADSWDFTVWKINDGIDIPELRWIK